MLLRRWTTQIDPDRAAEYEAFAKDISLPMFRAHAGLVAVLMSRSGDIATVQTLWENEACISALDRSPLYRQTVSAIQSAGFLGNAQRVEIEDLHLAFWPPIDAIR